MNQCEKCGELNRQVTKYHVGCGGIEIGSDPGPRCEFYDINQRNDEHLHIYCQCGYDWIVDVLKSPEVIEINIEPKELKQLLFRKYAAKP